MCMGGVGVRLHRYYLGISTAIKEPVSMTTQFYSHVNFSAAVVVRQS